MSLRRAGAGTLQLLRAYAATSAGQQGQLLVRAIPAALQLSKLPCPLTQHSQQHRGWWQQQHLTNEWYRQLATAPDSSLKKEENAAPAVPKQPLPGAQVRG